MIAMSGSIFRHAAPPFTRKTVRFTPPEREGQDGTPVYILKVPTKRDQIEFKSAIAGSGLRYPSNEELFECMRDDLRVNVQAFEPLIAAIDAYEEQVAALDDFTAGAVDQLAEIADDERDVASEKLAKDAPKVDPSLVEQVNKIEKDMRAHCPAYNDLLRQRTRFNELYPLMVVEQFLVGWENVDAEFQRANGLVDDESLSAIPDDHIRAIFRRMMELIAPTPDQVKNSASPSGSSQDPSNFPEDGAPRTAVNGISTESASEPTQPA
jgi:hypothetical protein